MKWSKTILCPACGEPCGKEYPADETDPGFREGKGEEFVEIAPGLNAELDENGRVIGIEILNASNFLKSVAKPLYKHMQSA